MRTALVNELSICEVVDAQDAHGSTHCEIFVAMGDCYRVQLLRFALVRTRIQNCLSIHFPQVPVGDTPFLANRQELVLVEWADREAIEATHALLLSTDALFSLEVPAEDRLVAGAREQVRIIGEQLNLGHTGGVFLQVANEFTGTNFPNTDVTLHAARADELAAARKANGSDAALVSIIDLPKQLAVVDTVGANAAIRPSAQDYLIGKYRTVRHDTSDLRSHTPSSDTVVVGVPKADSAILGASNELV